MTRIQPEDTDGRRFRHELARSRLRIAAPSGWGFNLLLLAVEVLLAACVIRWIGSGHLLVLRITAERGSLWWTQFPWYAAAAAFAGAIALVTFLFTRAQNQQQFERQQAAEQERFDRQELCALFIDIQNRFASENAMMRANAAIRLAEMAQTLLPGKSAVRARENYPFFSRTASQLAAALHMEQDQAVRDEVMKALNRMKEFARGGDQALLEIQINELADANRSAQKGFVEALARYCSLFPERTDDNLRPLIGLAPFCLAPHRTLVVLRDLAASKKCRDAASVHAALRAAQRSGAVGVSEAEDRLRVLPDLQSNAARLIDTRTALVCALHARRAPEMPSPRQDLLGGEIAPHGRLDLRETQLQGANLQRTHLQGAILDDAQLQEANLQGTQLQGARLYGAHMEGTKLAGAHVRSAKGEDLPDADFAGVNWWEADFMSPGGGSDDRLITWLEEQFPRPPQAQKRKATPAGATADRAATTARETVPLPAIAEPRPQGPA
jgi:hypothetical protein